MTVTSPSGVINADRSSGCRLLPWPLVAEPTGPFDIPPRARPEGYPVIIAGPKQTLLDDVRKLVLRGVEPRPDGLERSPTEHSLAVAEQLVLSLPDDLAMPSASLPDDGEITFSWQTVDNQGERWRAVLAIAPDSEVECFVRRRTKNRPVAHFRTDAGVEQFGLPDDIVNALRTHWRAG